MGFLLRIIDQTLAQCEHQRNYDLGNSTYSYLVKTANGIQQSEKTVFETALDEAFKGVPCTVEEKEKAKVIVFSKDRPYIIDEHEVAYIVNDEGKTIERIYGQYIKY